MLSPFIFNTNSITHVCRFYEDMAKNIFIMIVSLTLKCGEVKSFVKAPLWQHAQKQIMNTNIHRLCRFKMSSY